LVRQLSELVARGWSGPRLVDVSSQLNDFSDTAALIENLDLVISVDTATAHLAAALGKPVWILSRFDNCWRWLLDRSDSPWYPTVRCIARSDTATGMLSCKESPQICTNSSPEYMLHVR
jgi:ADP-heptose:LPS heptosyltransferase